MTFKLNANLSITDLLPAIIGLLAGIALLVYLYYRNWDTISTWRIVIWLVWTFLIYAVLGLVSIKMDALPYSYTIIAVCSALLGVLYLKLAPRTLDWWQKMNLEHVFLFNITLHFFGISGFSLLYNLLSVSSISVYTQMPATLAILIPALVSKSYYYWMHIPKKKYRTWLYPLHAAVPRLQPVDTVKLVMNFTPEPSGKNGPFENYQVEFPANETLNDLFHYFITFHNKHREYRKRPIQFIEGDRPLEWMLFKYNAQKKKVYLDMDKTLVENQVAPNEHIYAFSTID
jgi:hypothetical protein